MSEFFASGHAVDVVLAVLLIEALWMRFKGASWAAIAGALLPAVLMMVALRSALTGAAWPLIAVPLMLAFPVHLYDLRKRPIEPPRNS